MSKKMLGVRLWYSFFGPIIFASVLTSGALAGLSKIEQGFSKVKSVAALVGDFDSACKSQDLKKCLQAVGEIEQLMKKPLSLAQRLEFFERAACVSQTKSFVRKMASSLLPSLWAERLKNLFLSASRGKSELTKKRIKECSSYEKCGAGLALEVAVVYKHYQLLKDLLEDEKCSCSKLSVEQGTMLLTNLRLWGSLGLEQKNGEEYLTAFFEKKATKENITACFFRRLLQLRAVLSYFDIWWPLLTYLPSAPYEEFLGLFAAVFDWKHGSDLITILTNYSTMSGNDYILSGFWGYLDGLIGDVDKTPRSTIDFLVDNADISIPAVTIGLQLAGKVLNSKYGKKLTLRPLGEGASTVSYPFDFDLDSKRENLFFKQ